MASQSGFIIQGVEKTIKALTGISKDDAPFVTAYALTKTGQDIKAAEYASMQSVFDRPTKYALNSLQLTPATKKNLQAVVYYRQFSSKGIPAERYLGPEVAGGTRSHKSHEKALIAAGLMRSEEYAVPGRGADIDQYGNMKTGQIVRILSQLRASRDPMQNITERSRRRAVRAAKGQYFVVRGASIAEGVYQRVDGNKIMPILMFVRAPNYKSRFPFYDVGRKVFNDRLVFHASAGWERAIKSRRIK